MRDSETLDPIDKWPWGRIGKRLGSRRSADGIVYDLPDAEASGNKVVLKLIFSNDSTGPMNEIILSKAAGRFGIGPKIFKSYVASIDGSKVSENIVSKGLLNQRGRINLFQNYRFGNFKYVFMIVMENLYYNPAKGVIKAFTLMDLAERKPGTEGLKIPFASLRAKLTKLHDLAIIHGDMHTGNIMLQVKSDGKTDIRIIDFGRSVFTTNSLNDDGANKYLLMRGYRYNHAPTRNGQKSHVVNDNNGIARYRNKAAIEFVENHLGNLFESPNVHISPVPRNSPNARISPVPRNSPKPNVESLGIRMGSNGQFYMKGKKGQIKVRLTVAQLKNYAMKRGVNITGAKRKENIMRKLVGVPISAAPGRRVKAPKKAVNKMTIAELKEYAKKKKIDLKGLRLKKNILARVKA